MKRIRSEIIEKLLKASPKKQKAIIERLGGTQFSKKKEPPRERRFDFDRKGKWSKDLIIDTLRRILLEHERLSLPLLRKLREEDPKNYPAPTTVVYRFGSWNEAKKEVSGRAQPPYLDMLGKMEGIDYFLTLYHQGNIKTRNNYFEARRNYPEIVPPYSWLLNVFGTFTNFKKIAKIDSCSDQIKSLVQLVNDLGGVWPKRYQCESRNIDIEFLDKRMDGRAELKGIVRELRRTIYKSED